MSIPALKRAVNRLIKAEIEASWKGSMYPSDWPEVDRKLASARRNYNDALGRLRVEFQQVRLP